MEEVDPFGSPLYDFPGLLVFLFDNYERPDSLFALADDVAVFDPLPECQAILLRVVSPSFFFAPTLRNLFPDQVEGVLRTCPVGFDFDSHMFN